MPATEICYSLFRHGCFLLSSAVILAMVVDNVHTQGQEWTPHVNACIPGHNDVILDPISFADCQAHCESQGAGCQSMEYNSGRRRCSLTGIGGHAKVKPCPGNGWFYTEKINSINCPIGPNMEQCCKECFSVGCDLVDAGCVSPTYQSYTCERYVPCHRSYVCDGTCKRRIRRPSSGPTYHP